MNIDASDEDPMPQYKLHNGLSYSAQQEDFHSQLWQTETFHKHN